MNVAALSVPLSAANPAPIETLAASSPTDLDRLRSLMQSAASQTANPIGTAAQLETAPVAATRSFGDSILDGMLKFRSNYQSSIDSINLR